MDLPTSVATGLSAMDEMCEQQKAAKSPICKPDDSSRLPKFDWHVDVSSDHSLAIRQAISVVKQLFEKFELHSMVSLIDINHLKH